MKKAVKVFVKGVPYPFQRPRKGRFGNWYNEPEYTAWKYLVCLNTRQSIPIPPPYEVTTVFCMPRPKNPKYAWPSSNDWDNLFKGVLDGLKEAGAITDDRHVIRPGPGSCKKYAKNQVGVEIRVRHIPVEEI